MKGVEKILEKQTVRGGIALMTMLAAVACSSPVKGEAQMKDSSQELSNGDCAFSTVLTPDDSKKIISGDIPSYFIENLDPKTVGVMEELDVLAQADKDPDDQHANQLTDQSFSVADKILRELYTGSPEANIKVYTDILPDLTDVTGEPLKDGDRLVEAVYANCPQPALGS